jgi:hypothetical protein
MPDALVYLPAILPQRRPRQLSLNGGLPRRGSRVDLSYRWYTVQLLELFSRWD